MSHLSETLTAKAAELGISQTELAERTGMLQQSISALFNGEVAAPRKWREIARELQISEEDMRQMMIEAGRVADKTTRLPKLFRKDPYQGELYPPPNAVIGEPAPPISKQPKRLIPVYGQAVGGEDGEYIFNGSIIDYVDCPPSLENVVNAYSVFVAGESMSPRYRPGETVWVHPGKPPRKGDDVIVQLHAARDDGSPPRGYVKAFVGWTSNKLVLEQYNPQKRIEFNRDEVVSVHPIVLSGKY